MKRIFIYLALFTVLVTAGCTLFKNPNGSAVSLSETATIIGNTKGVSFKIVLPGQLQQNSNIRANVRANTSTATPTVTFKLTLINIGDMANSTTILKKVVTVNASGTAQATFIGVPAKTVIADVSIANGKIASGTANYQQFHGALDLIANNDNIVEVSPKGSKTMPDFLAEILTKIVGDKTNFTKLAIDAATKIKVALVTFDLSSGDYDGAIETFQTYKGPLLTISVATTPRYKQNTVMWSSVPGATSYNIYYNTTSGVTKNNGTKLTGKTSPFTHKELKNDTTYYYVVTTVNSTGESEVSNETSVKTVDPTDIDLGGGLNMNFVHIGTGSFVMGEVDSYDDEKPTRTVTLSKDFYMGKSEVTQAQYEKLMGNHEANYDYTTTKPVETANWYDAVRFCNALSVQQGLEACYTDAGGDTTIDNGDIITCKWTSTGYRLPTEAEWEYCCRAGMTTTYSWGDSREEVTMKANAWYRMNAYSSAWTRPHAEEGGRQPVGTKPSNAWGLYDMHGNVSEWCWDWYSANYYGQANNTTDPTGPTTGLHRIHRGGHWKSTQLRSADRMDASPNVSVSEGYGFRVLLVR